MSAAQEIEDFPLFLGEIKNALGKNNTNSTGVSLSVAGTKEGMLAFNSTDQAKKIWENIDFITVMAYDLVNRVSNATSHHSSVEGSRQAVQYVYQVPCNLFKYAIYLVFLITDIPVHTGDISTSALTPRR